MTDLVYKAAVFATALAVCLLSLKLFGRWGARFPFAAVVVAAVFDPWWAALLLGLAVHLFVVVGRGYFLERRALPDERRP